MRTYFDSSALAKRYIQEVGTESVLEHCREAEEVVLSVLTVPELVSAFNRLRREGHLETQQYDRLKAELAADLRQATVVDLTPEVIQKAVQCLESAALRALDALHVGAAAVARVDLFVSADDRQCEGARQLGMTVVHVAP